MVITAKLFLLLLLFPHSKASGVTYKKKNTSIDMWTKLFSLPSCIYTVTSIMMVCITVLFKWDTDEPRFVDSLICFKHLII
jgi:hypothetical protein